MTIQANFPAIKPSLLLDFANTKQLDPRITFTRASTASYYDGVTTAKAEENLFFQSQTFNTSWTTSNATITADQTTAPDGTTTAELVYPSSTGTYRSIQQNIVTNASLSVFTTTLNKTISFFAKASGFSWVFTADSSSGAKRCFFDLTNGVTGTTAASHTSSITSVGNGWYRCVVTTSDQYTGTLAFAVSDADNNVTATASGTNGIYIWGAQVEQRSAVTAYTATTTQAITNYIPVLQTAASGVARFDNNPTTSESLGLLIEESRTNLFTYSEQFDNAGWSKSATTATANAVISPDGTLTADKLISDSTSGFHSITQTLASKTASTAYTFSFYAKAGEIGFCLPNFSSGLTGSSLSCTVNLSTGAITGATAGLTTTSTSVRNGWWRFTLTATGAANTTGFGSTINTTDASGTASHTGNGFSGIYIWGAQLEAGAFATSYIPTVASQVTRAADAASMTGTNFSSWFSADQGTIYSEFNRTFADTSNSGQFVMISDGSATNRLFMQYSASSNFGIFEIIVGGATQASINSAAMTIGSYHKMGAAYKVNDIASSVDGATVGTDTSATIPVVNQMSIGNRGYTSAGFLNGTIKKIAYYPLRVTNAQLQSLTS